MTVAVLRADARDLPLADDSVDLIVTSPPYFALRSYTDAGEHYAGQIGSEPTPGEFLDALLEVTRECMRVLKPTGSLWVNLGDKYSSGKSLIGIPWRYALRCIDDLGLILRAEVIWSKPNGLPESVTDRVRRSHEQWFHFTKASRYFAAVDEIREASADTNGSRARALAGRDGATGKRSAKVYGGRPNEQRHVGVPGVGTTFLGNPLGKLPGSVWDVATQPLKVPAELGIDHFAAFPVAWPLRLIAGWCPREVCTACGEGRRPVSERGSMRRHNNGKHGPTGLTPDNNHGKGASTLDIVPDWRITGYACACPDTSAPATPGVVLDPFGGTGTTALAAHALGRHGISVDLSADYCRLAEWRTSDRGEIARVLGVPKPPVEVAGQADLFDLIADDPERTSA